MTVIFNVEKYDDCFEEVLPLLQDHYEEVAMYQDNIELNPDYSKYKELCDNGALHIVTARDEGELVGYFISIIVDHIHYKDHKYALNDIVFLKQHYRNQRSGVGLFQYAENALKDLGVSVITIHMKTKLPFDALCKGLGYDYAERNYSKYIGE